jgi:hypothetical protein
MKFYVIRQYRSVSRIHSEWWWFFSIPYEFSVWYKPREKNQISIRQFFDQQIQLAEEYLLANPTNPASGPNETHI